MLHIMYKSTGIAMLQTLYKLMAVHMQQKF